MKGCNDLCNPGGPGTCGSRAQRADGQTWFCTMPVAHSGDHFMCSLKALHEGEHVSCTSAQHGLQVWANPDSLWNESTLRDTLLEVRESIKAKESNVGTD